MTRPGELPRSGQECSRARSRSHANQTEVASPRPSHSMAAADVSSAAARFGMRTADGMPAPADYIDVLTALCIRLHPTDSSRPSHLRAKDAMQLFVSSDVVAHLEVAASSLRPVARFGSVRSRCWVLTSTLRLPGCVQTCSADCAGSMPITLAHLPRHPGAVLGVCRTYSTRVCS